MFRADISHKDDDDHDTAKSRSPAQNATTLMDDDTDVWKV